MLIDTNFSYSTYENNNEVQQFSFHPYSIICKHTLPICWLFPDSSSLVGGRTFLVELSVNCAVFFELVGMCDVCPASVDWRSLVEEFVMEKLVVTIELAKGDKVNVDVSVFTAWHVTATVAFVLVKLWPGKRTACIILDIKT